jgi:hypothetical protein
MKTMAKKTPCDYGECPYDAQYSEACRVYCGLGVDEACDENEFDDDCYGIDEDMELLAHIEGRSGHGDYSPSAPWNAPGMKVSDFI